MFVLYADITIPENFPSVLNTLTAALISDYSKLDSNYQNIVNKLQSAMHTFVNAFHWLSIRYIFNLIHTVDHVLYVITFYT